MSDKKSYLYVVHIKGKHTSIFRVKVHGFATFKYFILHLNAGCKPSDAC